MKQVDKLDKHIFWVKDFYFVINASCGLQTILIDDFWVKTCTCSPSLPLTGRKTLWFWYAILTYKCLTFRLSYQSHLRGHIETKTYSPPVSPFLEPSRQKSFHVQLKEKSIFSIKIFGMLANLAIASLVLCFFIIYFFCPNIFYGPDQLCVQPLKP